MSSKLITILRTYHTPFYTTKNTNLCGQTNHTSNTK